MDKAPKVLQKTVQVRKFFKCILASNRFPNKAITAELTIQSG
jgi:hypothetical protein